jgi:hypothetical protein
MSRAWREASVEMPPAHLDDAIRAAARRAVHAGPERVRRSFAQRWRVPLSIAAVLVVSATLTLMIAEHEEHLPSSSSENARSSAAESPASVGADTRGVADNQAPRPQAAVPAERPATTPPAAKTQPAPESPPAQAHKRVDTQRAPEREGLEPYRETPAAGAMRDQAVAPPVAQPVPAPAAAPVAVPPSEQDTAASERRRLEEAPMLRKREQPARLRAAPEPAAAGEAKARAELPASNEGRAGQARERVKEEPPGLATPEQWLERIRQLRREGRVAEAQESLKAFRERYPDYPLPEDLAPPH